MKIAIIGAGWYGCHLTLFFQKLDYEVTLYEKNNKIFSGMSGYNSNRLHKGFHYPRSYITRLNCRKSFDKFKLTYPSLTKKIKNNFIGIHNNSLIDLNTYKQILRQSDLKFNENFVIPYNFKNVEGFIKCDEELIDFEKSKKFFENKIKKIEYNQNIKKIDYKNNNFYIDKRHYDWIIDCSACTLEKKYNFNVSFEPRITLLYESKLKQFACMLMDGKFWSIYPRSKNIYTLGSVIYSRISSKTNILNAKKIINNLNKEKLKKIIINFEKQVMSDFPNFKDLFTYAGYYTSLTTLYNSFSDSRPIIVNRNKNLIQVLGSKIDNVIEIEKQIKKIIK